MTAMESPMEDNSIFLLLFEGILLLPSMLLLFIKFKRYNLFFINQVSYRVYQFKYLIL